MGAKLLRSEWSLPELHPGSFFSDNRLKSYIHTNFNLDIQAEFWHAVNTDTSICICSFWICSPFRCSTSHRCILALRDWTKTKGNRDSGVFRKRCCRRRPAYKGCRNVPSPSVGPPLLERSLCVQWGSHSRRSKMAIFGVFSHFCIKRCFSDINKSHSSSFLLHLLVLSGPPVGYSTVGNLLLVIGRPWTQFSRTPGWSRQVLFIKKLAPSSGHFFTLGASF